MSKESKTFHIKINDWVFYDPKFKKNYNGYFPLSRSFLASKSVQKLSGSQFTYLIALIDLAHTYRSPMFDLPSTLIRANGVLCDTLLSKLQQNQILNFSTNKEIKELIKEEETLLENLKIPQENFSKYFQDFVMNQMGSSDLGFIKNYHLRAKSAFVTISAFEEFCNQVMGNKTFNGIDADNQIAYFKKAFTDELQKRKCL